MSTDNFSGPSGPRQNLGFTARPGSLRTELRVFEPQLASALGWGVAGVLAVLTALVGSQPPEFMSLACGVVALLLLLRIAVGQIAGNVFRYLVRDSWRTLLYMIALLLALAATVVSASAARSLPWCVPIESITNIGLPSLGRYHVADVAAMVIVAALTLVEPLLFRRSLAVQFLWPSTSLSYWGRWITRIVAPSLILVAGLGLHRAAADRLWGPHLDARKLAGKVQRAVRPAPEVQMRRDKGGLGRAMSAALEDEATVVELVTVAMCQRDDELAEDLVDTMHQQRRVEADIWRELEDYVYRKATVHD